MGHDADKPALDLLALHYPAYAGVSERDVFLHVGAPVFKLVLQRGVVHAVFLAAHLDKAGGKVLLEIILKRARTPGIARVEVFLEAGVVYRRGAVHDGIVVVENKAFVFHV